jgi:hypothetical protein
MDTQGWLGVTHGDAFEFFLEHLKDVTEDVAPPPRELLYNASVLAHYATTSTASRETFPASPASLIAVFDTFILDASRHSDPEILEAAASQCLLLTGFFCDQQRRRHNIRWYAAVGTVFYDRAADRLRDNNRGFMMKTMAKRFEFWRQQQRRLARELREAPSFLPRPTVPEPKLIM